MDIKEGTMSQRIGKALSDIEESSEMCAVRGYGVRCLRVEGVKRLLQELLEEAEERNEDKGL